jgi:putative oxidoreductase
MFHNQIATFREKYHDVFYTVFRILIGLLFAQHGAQKLFGFFGGTAATDTLMRVAGVIELVGGLLIAVGLLTGIASALSAITMVVAYFKVHFSFDSMIPIVNRGELALVFLSAFVLILLMGGGEYSLDRKIWGTKAAPTQEMTH